MSTKKALKAQVKALSDALERAEASSLSNRRQLEKAISDLERNAAPVDAEGQRFILASGTVMRPFDFRLKEKARVRDTATGRFVHASLGIIFLINEDSYGMVTVRDDDLPDLVRVD